MIIGLIPNLVLAIVAILAFGFQLGFDRFKEYPYIIIPMYLLFFGWAAFWMKWDEPKEDEEERQEFIKDIKQSIIEANSPTQKSIEQLVNEIRQERNERNNKPKQ